MNWIDLLLIFVLLLAAWIGWRRGFIIGSLNLLTWPGSIALAYLLYPLTATALAKIVHAGVWHLAIAFILIAIVSRVLIGFIVNRILKIIPEQANHDKVNRFLGVIPGFINGLIFATIITEILFGIPLQKNISSETQKSGIAKTLSVPAAWANKKLAPVFEQVARQTMNSQAENSTSHELVDLHFTYDNPEVRPELEKRMLEMINKERAKEGLKPLKADPQETMVARAHSKDMFQRGFFAHTDPDGKDPFDRMKAARLKFSTAGENLALAQTLENAHTNLMNSPGHRANIMSRAFTRVGIGIQDGGFYGIMISQEFRN
jgi:uncharacterized protein YkwD